MDMTNAEIIHDLEAIKETFMEQTNGCYPISLEAAINIIQNIDYIQTEWEVERPKGEWIFRSGITCQGYYKCSKCGEVERAEKNYCSNCGAIMRKGSADMKEDSENGQQL